METGLSSAGFTRDIIQAEVCSFTFKFTYVVSFEEVRFSHLYSHIHGSLLIT